MLIIFFISAVIFLTLTGKLGSPFAELTLWARGGGCEPLRPGPASTVCAGAGTGTGDALGGRADGVRPAFPPMDKRIFFGLGGAAASVEGAVWGGGGGAGLTGGRGATKSSLSSTGSALGLALKVILGLTMAAGATTDKGRFGDEDRESPGPLAPRDGSRAKLGARDVSRGLAAGPTLGNRSSSGFVGSVGKPAFGEGCSGDGWALVFDEESLSLRANGLGPLLKA